MRGTSSYCDDAQLLTQLTLNLDPELHAKAAKTGPHKDLSTWIEAVTEIDRERQQDKKRLHEHMESFMCSHKQPFVPSRPFNGSENPLTTATSSTPSSSTPYPPRLTEEERRLLQEHDGCFKCRTFYAGHRQATCTTTVMRQVPAVRASEQLEAAWDREVRVPPGVRMDSKMGCSSHTGLATRKQRVGAHARAPLRSAVRPWAGEGI